MKITLTMSCILLLSFFIIFGYASEDTVLRLSVSNIISSINQQNPCSKNLKVDRHYHWLSRTYCHCFYVIASVSVKFTGQQGL